MGLREAYERNYGKDLKWENIEELLERTIKDHTKNISNQYIDKTTLMSGKFIGDKRIADLISNTPLRIRN